MYKLDGQIALVTGASRGIGAATAEALAAAGAHVILVGRDAAALELVEERIHAAGGNATIAPLGTLAPVAATDMKEMTKLFTLNVIAQQAMISAFEPLLRRAAAGKLVALTSSVARTPRAYWGPYAASKAALENLVTTFGEEMKNISNVRTAIVDPGATRTTMRARAFPGEDAATLKGPEVVGQAIADLVVNGFASTEFVALPK